MVQSETRRHYAEEIRATAKIASEAVVKAFAAVPREDFVGAGPWTVLSRSMGQMQPQITDVTDPKDLYQASA